MTDAYKCNRCDVFYEGKPTVQATFDAPLSCSPNELHVNETATADLCSDCWEKTITELGFRRTGDTDE